MDNFGEILLDSAIDALKILPIIFVIYILIEIVESHSATNKKFKRLLTSDSAPVFGAAIGVIPQCGFSVVATKLYQGKYILFGTLISVYFATSDEALPILLSQAVGNPEIWLKLGLLIAIKFSYAVVIGFILNALVKRKPLKEIDEDVITEAGEDACCHHDVAEKHHGFWEFLIHPLTHSLKIFLYVLVINIVFGVLINVIGEESIASFLDANVFLQPIVATVIGIIPNCASSVLITQLFASDILSLGGAVAGLTVNSGLGLAVLLKDRKNLKKSLLTILLMVVLSLLLGYAVTGVSLLF